jgi:hypothetical protein
MSTIAEQVSTILEKNNLLPAHHFVGRPGRTTADSLHLLETTMKNAWLNGKVTLILFLDIEGARAFPNAVTDRLAHNMRRRHLPPEIVDFTIQMLTGRKAQLRFNDSTNRVWNELVHSRQCARLVIGPKHRQILA